MDERLDILAFGAHPDDVEIGAAGTLIKHARAGKKVGICDLTYAELSTNGTVQLRQAEAKLAARRIGAQVRLNLGFPDRGLEANRETICKVVEVIRRFRPAIMLAPFWQDRHPDHEKASGIVREAVFSAGIGKYEAGEGMPTKHRVSRLYFYFINDHVPPQFVVDVSDVYEEKKAALFAYRSQFFAEGEDAEKTVLNEGYLEAVEARDRLFGKEQGVAYAEGFVSRKPYCVSYFE